MLSLLAEWLQRINALNNAGQYPRAMDLDSIYCRLSYGRGSRSVTPLVEASSSDFLCPYRTHCFALCHCCDFDACDCEMTCPPNCSCYHDQSWSTNVVDCSANQVTPSTIQIKPLKSGRICPLKSGELGAVAYPHGRHRRLPGRQPITAIRQPRLHRQKEPEDAAVEQLARRVAS